MTVFTKVKGAPKIRKASSSKMSTTICADSAVYQRDDSGMFGRVRKYRTFISLCMMLLLVWLLLASFMVGTFFYRQLHRRPTYYGWCGTSFVQRGRKERLEESLEINPDEFYERISVPRFGMNRPAVFVHDFKKNVTAIVDVSSNRCFIKKLDRTVVATPTSLIELIEKMERGYYRSPTVIRRTYRIVGRMDFNDIEKLESLVISQHCLHRAIFTLSEASRSIEHPRLNRHKREVFEPLQFSVLSGHAIEMNRILTQ